MPAKNEYTVTPKRLAAALAPIATRLCFDKGGFPAEAAFWLGALWERELHGDIRPGLRRDVGGRLGQVQRALIRDRNIPEAAYLLGRLEATLESLDDNASSLGDQIAMSESCPTASECLISERNLADSSLPS